MNYLSKNFKVLFYGTDETTGVFKFEGALRVYLLCRALYCVYTQILLGVEYGWDVWDVVASAIILFKVIVWNFVVVYTMILIFPYLVEMNVSRMPGCCYCSMFKFGARQTAYQKYGFNPPWAKFKDDLNLDRKCTYVVDSCDETTVHVGRYKNGSTFDETASLLKDKLVGSEHSLLPSVKFVARVQPLTRLFAWVTLVYFFNAYFSVAFGIVMASVFFLGFDLLVVAFAVGGLVSLVGDLAFAVAIGLVFFLLSNLLCDAIAKAIKSSWTKPEAYVPSERNYPEGIDPGVLKYNYTDHNVNANFEKTEFTDDGNLIGEDRIIFMEQTGITSTVTKNTGNPHRFAAMMSRYFKWDSAKSKQQFVKDSTMDDYVINIGGTFRGWPCQTAGLSIQPEFDEGDSANIRRSPGNGGYGQRLICQPIGTKTLPVGSSGEQFDPKWRIAGLKGATMWMVHCYDIPVKALLACASVNESPSVNVVMHSCPSMFIHKTGNLPFTGQTWSVDGNNNVEFKWKSTSGRVWRHNHRIIYEHLFTNYVQVQPGVWYVSEITRTLCDVYKIVWTRQITEPKRADTRRLILRDRRDATNVPMLFTGEHELVQAAGKLETFKQLEEYVQTSKDKSSMAVNCRAVSDGTTRNKGSPKPHLNYNDVTAIYKAEQFRRDLEELTTGKHGGFFEVFGLKPDPILLCELADKALECLMEQPANEVDCETLVQTEPYVTADDYGEPCPPRLYPLPKINQTGALYTQETLDVKEPLAITKFYGEGDNMGEHLCSLLFGVHKTVPAVLPVGSVGMGGSQLVQSGSGLLPTEIEYLTTTSKVAFIVRSVDGKTKCYGVSASSDMRQPIVYLDFTIRRVTRIHSPRGLRLDRLMSLLEAFPGDLEDNNNWISELGGSARRYEEHPDFSNVARSERAIAVSNEMTKRSGDTTAMEMLGKLLKPDVRRVSPLMVNGDITYFPHIVQDDYQKIYDGGSRVMNGPYPPAHIYADKSIKIMRQLVDSHNPR